MNPEAQELLNKIVAKDINDITESDKAVLRARRSYLSAVDEERLAEVMDEQPVEQKEEKDKSKETKALRARAKELGINYVGMTTDALRVAISTIEGPGGMTDPQ